MEIIQRNVVDIYNGLFVWIIMNTVVFSLHYSLVLINNFNQFQLLIEIIDDNRNKNNGSSIENGETIGTGQLYKQFHSRQQSRLYQRLLIDIIYMLITLIGLIVFSTASILMYDFQFIGSIMIMAEMVL